MRLADFLDPRLERRFLSGPDRAHDHGRDGLAGGGDLRSTEWAGYGTPRIIRELKNSRNWKVRRASALALGELAHTSMYARQALRNSRGDRDPRVRKAIEATLDRTLTAAGREF